MIGALTAKQPKPLPDVPTAVVGTDRPEPNYKVTKEYWVTVLILCTVAVPLFAFSRGIQDDMDEPLAWAVLYAIVFPVVQLAASLVVGLRNAWSNRPGRSERLRHLGSITARAFIGGLFGVLAMFLLFGLR